MREGAGVCRRPPGLPLPVHWAGRSERWSRQAAELSQNVAENGLKSKKTTAGASICLKHGTTARKNQAKQPLLIVFVFDFKFNYCSKCARLSVAVAVEMLVSVAWLKGGEACCWPRSDSGKGMWLVIGWLFLAFQGHGVPLASLPAYPGSAPPLQLLSLTTGEETQNWQEVWGKWTLNSLVKIVFPLRFCWNYFTLRSF